MENPENQKVKSKRDAFLERMKGKYPDENFDDDESLYGKINDDYDEYDSSLSEYKSRESALSDMFSSDPRSASFLRDWKNGKDPAIQLVRMFGSEIKDAIDDPDKLEEIEEANREYLERITKSKELDEQYEGNLQLSLESIDAYQSENGLSDKELDKGMEHLAQIASDFIVGKIEKETLALIFKAINHDSDVEQAVMEGEARGKNAKIEERLRKAKPDMPASLASKNAQAPQDRKRPNMGAVDRFEDGNSIWERGKETRTKY